MYSRIHIISYGQLFEILLLVLQFSKSPESQKVHKKVSNRAFLVHKSQLPIFFMILQTLGPNTAVYLVKIFAIVSAFQGFNVKYCRFYLHLVPVHVFFRR